VQPTTLQPNSQGSLLPPTLYADFSLIKNKFSKTTLNKADGNALEYPGQISKLGKKRGFAGDFATLSESTSPRPLFTLVFPVFDHGCGSMLLPFAEDFAAVVVFDGDVFEACFYYSAGFLDFMRNASYVVVVPLFEKFFA
jgi:hypothetical protein